MKKLFSVLVVGGLLLAFACGGGGGKYADIKKVMQQTLDASEDFSSGLEKAGSADDVVSAINKFADTMKKLKPKMEELTKKYPELEKGGELPEELKSFEEKGKASEERMKKAMMKAMQYMADPKVQEALKKLGDLK